MKKFWLFCSLCCVYFSGFGQPNAAPVPNLPSFKTGSEILAHIYAMDMSYDSIASYAQWYNDSMPGDNSFNKRYGRWSDFWDSRVDVSGNFNTTFNNMLELADYRNFDDCVLPPDPICSVGGDWQQTGPLMDINTQNSGIIVTVASTDGQTIYAGSNTGGLWKTTDGGDSWSNMTDILGLSGLGINDVIIHPTNPDMIYIATGFNATFVSQNYGAGVWKSMDGGVSWCQTALSWNPNNLATTGEKLSINKLAFKPDAPDIVYALAVSKVFRLTNNGNFVSELTGLNIPNPKLAATDWQRSEYIDIDFLPKQYNQFNSNQPIIFISTRRRKSSYGKLLQSLDGGNAWTNISLPDPSNPPGQTAFPPHNDAIISCLVETAKDDPNDDDKLFVHYFYKDVNASTSNTAVYRYPLFELDITKPVGQQWDEKNRDNFQRWHIDTEFLNFEVNPQNADVMYFPGQIMGKSINRGANVTSIAPISLGSPPNGFVNSVVHADVRDIIITSIDNGPAATNSDELIMGNDGGVGKGNYVFGTNGVGYTWEIKNGNNSTMNGRLIATQCTDISVLSDFTANGTNRIIVGGAIDNANYIDNSSSSTNNWINFGNADGGQTAINSDYIIICELKVE